METLERVELIRADLRVEGSGRTLSIDPKYFPHSSRLSAMSMSSNTSAKRRVSRDDWVAPGYNRKHHKVSTRPV